MDIKKAFNEEAECAVIGSLVLHPAEALPICITNGCRKDWFYSPKCATAWDVINDMSIQNKFVDIITVCNHPVVRENGLEQWLHEECADIVTIAHLDHYLGILKEKWYHRKTTVLLADHLGKLNEEKEVEEVLSSLQFDMTFIENEVSKSAIKTPDIIRANALDAYEENKESGHNGLPSRWYKLQLKTCGYRKKKNTIIAARPGKGKTTFVYNEALHWAQKGFRVGGVCLEMSVEETYVKMACDLSGVDSFKYNKGDFNGEEYDKFKKALETISKLPIFLTDVPMDIKHICNWVKKMAKRHKLDAVFYDYIQIIGSGGSRKKRNEEISEYSKYLLSTAKEANVANVILSQISRSGEPPHNAKPDERWKYVPKLHNLKDSGSLEEDAYCVVILYPKPDVNIDPDEMVVVPYVFDCAKNRGGPTGRIYPTFRKDYNRFEIGGS